MNYLQPQQSVTNMVAHRCSSAESNRWRDDQADPELLSSGVEVGSETVKTHVPEAAKAYIAKHVGSTATGVISERIN